MLTVKIWLTGQFTVTGCVRQSGLLKTQLCDVIVKSQSLPTLLLHSQSVYFFLHQKSTSFRRHIGTQHMILKQPLDVATDSAQKDTHVFALGALDCSLKYTFDKYTN